MNQRGGINKKFGLDESLKHRQYQEKIGLSLLGSLIYGDKEPKTESVRPLSVLRLVRRGYLWEDIVLKTHSAVKCIP
jgi:hypothetical protein